MVSRLSQFNDNNPELYDPTGLENYPGEQEIDPVAARFALYGMADAMDTHEVGYVGSLTRPTMSLLEVGAAGGGFFRQVKQVFGHQGVLVGVDLFDDQINRGDKLDEINIIPYLEQQGVLTSAGVQFATQELQQDWSLIQGDASKLYFEDDSFERIFAFYMMYHLSPEQRVEAFKGFKRVLRPEGVAVISTSGNENKKEHREFEVSVAEQLSSINDIEISPPPHMNQGFTTEKAMLELPEHFAHVFMKKEREPMILRDNLDIEMYILSQKSLMNLYRPTSKFTKDQFDNVLDVVVRQAIVSKIKDAEHATFEDQIRRSVFFATNDANFVPSGEGIVEIS